MYPFQTGLTRLLIEEQIYRAMDSLPELRNLISRIQNVREREYLLSKVARPYFFTAEVTLTGTGANEEKSGFSTTIGHDLIIVAATSNAPSADVLVSVRDTTQDRKLTAEYVPPTALFSSLQNTTERYFRWTAPVTIKAGGQIQVNVRALTAVTQTITFGFMAIWVADEVWRGGNQQDKELDAWVMKLIKENSMQQPYVLKMNSGLTGVANETPAPQTTTPFNKPFLLCGIQQSIANKTGSFITDPPTLQIVDQSSNYLFSNTAQKIWQLGNYITDPEQFIALPYPYLVRPNAQLLGLFKNSPADAVTGGQVIYVGKTP